MSTAGWRARPGCACARATKCAFACLKRETGVEAQNIDLRVVYEDSDLAVVFKPSGISSIRRRQPGRHAGQRPALPSGQAFRHRRRSGPGWCTASKRTPPGFCWWPERPRPCRWRSRSRNTRWSASIWAICIGHSGKTWAWWTRPSAATPPTARRWPSASGRRAVTHWRVLEELRGASYIEARLETRRTHQIRVHMASLGHRAGRPGVRPKDRRTP